MARYVKTYDAGDAAAGVIIIAMVSFIFALIGAWVTHVVCVIGKLAGDAGVTMGQAILGVLGLFVPPIGVIHGIMIWFGAGVG